MKTKTQFMNRILSLVLSIMMVVSMLPMNILTANAAETTESAIDLSTLTGTYVISDSGEYTFTGSGSYGIKVESGNPTIVLNNASITVGEGSAIDVASGSNATIFVQNDNSLSTTAQYSDTTAGGIFVAEGGTVNITSNSTNNTIRVTGNTAAAIGGKYACGGESYNAGCISISNVTVYAYTNNFYASAIGAAGEGTCGTINITNAVIYAYGAGDRWTSAPGIGNAWSLLDWSDTIPIVIISDSEVHTFRYNPYSDYIGYLGDESGDTYATGSINCGDGGSVTNSTIYCYTGLTVTTTDKVVKYGALGGLLKEDGTCEGEHSGGTQTCMGYKCANCANWYGEKNENHDWSGKDGICTNGCGTTHDHAEDDWNNGFCTGCDAYEPATDYNADGVYEIYNAGQLFWFAQQVNEEGNKEIKGTLRANIDLENRPWTPIGAMGEENSFRGVFEGLNYTIRGLYVEGSENGVGFFGEVRTGTVRNFTIYGEVVVNTEVDYVGGVIGSICGVNGETDLERNGAIIQNITSFVNVTAKAHGIGMTGGFVGHADHQSLIEQCSWYGTFDAGEYRVDSGAGGFIGKIQENTSEVTIRNCGAYGTIKTNYAGDYNNTATIYMGGFLSFSNTGAKTTLENCLFAGRFARGENLTDEARLGAFGTLRSVNAIKNCYYLGDDGLAAVHSDSDLKPGSDNVAITSVTGEELKEGTIATRLGEHWSQGEHYPVPNNDVWEHSHSYTYADNGDGTHDKVCDMCPYVEVDNEAHTGGTATCKEQAICGNCGASYGELLDHNWKKGECTYGCNTQHDPHDWESGICNVCGLVCAHTGGTATCTTLAVCESCGASYGELAAHTPDTNGKCTAENCGYQYAAKVGDTFYETIHKALRAAEGINGCTLTLLDDVTLTSMSSYASYVNTGTFTLDLNGKTLSSNKRTLEVMGSADLTIRDGIGGGKIVSTDSSAVYLSGGKLTIESGIFEGSLDGVFLSGSSTLTVKGGTFTGSRAMITGFGSNCVIDLTNIDPAGFTLKNNGSGTFAPKLPEGYGMVGSDGKLLTSLSAEQSATVHKHEYQYTDIGDGKHQQACSCGLTTGEPAAHSTTAEDDKAATCAASAYCSVCESYYGEVDKNNHDETVAYENGFCPYCDAFEPATDSDSNGYYDIDNAGKLYWFAVQVNSGKTNINGELKANIVINEDVLAEMIRINPDPSRFRLWTPIGTEDNAYIGDFCGLEHTVSGLYFNDSNAGYLGLFGYVGSGMVNHVGVIDSYFNGSGSVGGVVGHNEGTVEYAYNNSYVGGNVCIGGVVGDNRGTVMYAYNLGSISGLSEVGGVVGANYNTVKNCYNIVSISGDFLFGDVVGDNFGTLENCYYPADAETDELDGTTAKTWAQFKSGEVAYLLGRPFGQNIGTNSVPVLYGETVYYGYTSCGDTAAKYTNDETISAEKPDHTQKPTYTDNGDGTHSAFYSCCGTTVTEDHTLTYTAKDNVITAVCSANCGYVGKATISATGKTYDGTAVTADVEYSGGWPGSTDLTVTYAVKGGAVLTEAPKNAGTYTASITYEDVTANYDFTIEKATPTAEDFVFAAPTDLIYDGTAKPATITVKNGIVGMGEVNIIYFRDAGTWIDNQREPIYPGRYKVGIWLTEGANYEAVDSVNPLWLGDEFEIKYLTTDAKATISGTVGSNGWYTSDVTLTAPEGYQISKTKYNDGFVSELTFSAEQNETITYYLKDANGDVAEKTATLKIDKTAPSAQYQIGTDGWKQFINTITFGLFCKDYKTVDIEYTDALSGVAEKQYYISSEEITNTSRIAWLNYTDTLSLNATGKYFIYMRVVDNAGHEVILNTEGIVIYEDSVQVTESVSATYRAGTDKSVTVELKGNTVSKIVNGGTTLTAGTDYNVSADGTITLKASYLDTLNAGEYTFTVSYNPQGVETDKVNMTTTFTLIIDKADGKVSNINISNKTYDGTAVTAPTFDKLGDGAATIEYKVRGADDSTYTTTAPKDAGNYVVRVTVAESENYKAASATAEFTIGRASITGFSVKQDGKLTYNGKAQTPTVSTSATTVDGSKVTFTYSTESEGPYSTEIPSFTNAGWTHHVYYRATAENHNASYGSFLVEIEKATVTEPTIASKPYSGSAQTADISGTDLYTVEKNNGGTEKGSYDVVLKLKDSANYKWSTTDNAEVTLQFVISAAQNAWDTNPSISGWTYGEAAKTPVGTAKYGAVKVVYTGKEGDGTDYNSETAPTKAGNYTATFTVTGTEDYSGLSEQVNFTIAKKAVTVTANDAGKTYGESDPALTYTHTELVGSDALVITVARASGENANTYTITASQEDSANPNYEITFKTGTFTIHKATLTVTVEDKTATYGDPVPTYTVKYEGFKNGDDKDDLGGALAFECGYAQFSDNGEYTIKASGYTSGNYTISYVDGKLTVNAKPITVTIQNATSVYGDTLAELKATDNGIVNGDTNVYSLATTATGTSNVGKYVITGTALDDNYAITFESGEYDITKREITITIDAKNTVVNTALPTYTYKVEGLVGVDTLVTEPTLTCNANIALIGEYDITASGADAGGNYSIKYVPAKLTVLTDNAVDAAAGYTEELKDYDPATVTSEDKAELDEMLSEINTILADETTTSNGKKALEEVKEQVEKLIKEITDAAAATDTENTEKVENVTPENVTPENKTDLEGAKADLEKALEDNGGNYTEDEKKAIEDEIKRIDDALEVICNVEEVEETISKLPAVDTVKPDDGEVIKAITDAQTAYNALSDYEKSLVDEATKANLDKLVAALVAYDIVEGDGSSWTEDSDHNITFVANGLFSKFVGIKVDGKDVDKANYEAKAGSTIITLKASYMDTLAVGEHTISVVYTDGSTDGTFNVRAKANTPATGDDFNIALYASLMVVSVTALVVLLLVSKKRGQAR